jgi:hypothetical protein
MKNAHTRAKANRRSNPSTKYIKILARKKAGKFRNYFFIQNRANGIALRRKLAAH